MWNECNSDSRVTRGINKKSGEKRKKGIREVEYSVEVIKNLPNWSPEDKGA